MNLTPQFLKTTAPGFFFKEKELVDFTREAQEDGADGINTTLSYRYADGAGFTTDSSITVAGMISQDELLALLGSMHDGEFFVPGQVGIEALGRAPGDSNFAEGIEHPHHFFNGLEYTWDKPTEVYNTSGLVARFKHAAAHGWSIAEP
ncbi:hypothetical protein HNP46_000339 [Pseudomonas nitritireducens]|uniref:Uncharacterized protein n=1 Tax=Pseudomonas nitroreducens TaxID=46680 RepID=A0A7W7KG69_PSENT|nr:hypothetical protein [Pseudomonas nitritireducens]MBB4861528.1 hypothetical protein [Pseudomonas nitritireducens]